MRSQLWKVCYSLRTAHVKSWHLHVLVPPDDKQRIYTCTYTHQSIVLMCLYPWARYLVSIASLTWAHQGGISRGKYYNVSADKVCTWPVAPLGEAKWLWWFLDTVIIGSSALYPLAKSAIQMLIIISSIRSSQLKKIIINHWNLYNFQLCCAQQSAHNFHYAVTRLLGSSSDCCFRTLYTGCVKKFCNSNEGGNKS